MREVGTSKYFQKLYDWKWVQMVRERRGYHHHILENCDQWRSYRLEYHGLLVEQLESTESYRTPTQQADKLRGIIEEANHLLEKLNPDLDVEILYLRRPGNLAHAARTDNQASRAAQARANLIEARYKRSVLHERDEIGPEGIRTWIEQAKELCRNIDELAQILNLGQLQAI